MKSSDHPENQPADKKISKKEISKDLYGKLANTLSDYHLEGRKFENKLKKAARLLSAEIKKMYRKKEKTKKQKAPAEPGSAQYNYDGNTAGTLQVS